MAPIVAVTRPTLPGTGLERLGQFAEVRLWPDDVNPTPDQLRDLLTGADALLCQNSDRVDAAVLEAGERLRVLALPSAGYDGTDVAAARARGIIVTNTPGVLHETTADLAFALILMARRGLLAAADRLRTGRWTETRLDAYLGLDVTGASLGLIGYGEIGQAVARRAVGFGMTVQHTLSRKPDDALSRAVSLDKLLSTSDVVSLHVPLTEQTRHLIGAAELASMKPTATLVNTARGGVLDESALLAALRAGRLHSAGLDVFDREPRNGVGDPLLEHERVVALPHVGSATEATRARMIDLAVDNIIAVLNDKPPLTPVP
ncbi:2-hydroxyacid dehydrogenase [Nonomuraea guangzhouensis]|uniref:2-hydroxyacid dehydrogenase n=1 Tax=Nonomuraea guangzhouensis TaxID=1291555 RepID=A0ABW4G8V3_9ACTN|nr:D-glycerate dehydrogenase [Nonomuraea guangzhouensis]